MDKKAQHETLGFVLIVLIVIVIGVVFLTLIYSEKTENKTSVEVSNLLQSVMYYTSDCASDYNPRYRDVEDLTRECHTDNEKKCKDGRNACDVLKQTFEKALDESLNIGDDYKYRAYTLEAYFSGFNKEKGEDIVSIQKGNFNNCSSVNGAGIPVLLGSGPYSGGLIEVELYICNGAGSIKKTS